MSDVRALLRPRTRLAKPKPPASNFAKKCHDCAHPWHGTTCDLNGCACPTAWTNPTTEA